ncbi:hypothetical protein XELAEV_18022587mg [Xenopus laevis]|uniref:L1 transposable element RRM domain-containing protein n=1 Tax=Xenopus laevis TaxID=8355 RepID=A0A974D2N9_XENLA|nr:hypothetical protein XELAEV_18022587mg [Xenopus laevis]
MPNKLDLQNMGSNLKQTIFAETATLKQELTNVRDSIEELEDCMTQVTADSQAQMRTLQKHDQAILDLRRHTEDLENRRSRCNIRIRGIPENVPSEELRDLAVKLFSEVLDDSGTPQIPIERIHRVGIQRGTFLCCLARFEIKEQILQKARTIDGIHYEDNILHLYQDLAVSTITQRRLLRPLTLALREEEAPTVQPGVIPGTPTRRRDFTPSRQWRKRLNAQSPTRLPNTPRNKKPP